MNAQKLEFLRSQDWDDLALKTLNSVVFWARRYGWQPGETLPQKKFPEDVAWEVIGDFWAETRTYNPKWNLATQLRNAAKSKVSNLYARKETDTTKCCDIAELDPKKDCRPLDPTPEEVAGVRGDFARAIELLMATPKVKKNKDLQKLVKAIQSGGWETADLACKTGFSTSRVYQLQRELRDIYPTIAQKMGSDGGTTNENEQRQKSTKTGSIPCEHRQPIQRRDTR